MPIDKRIPRVLNSDLDSKTSERVSMEDALNLYSGPDNESVVGGKKLDGGDKVLKNIRGNVKVFEKESLPAKPRLLGSVEDTKTDITYLFIHSTSANGHGIWAYDRYGKLPNTDPNTLRLIYKSNQFNFPQNGFVKADIVYSSALSTLGHVSDEFEKDAIIYFTDGVNEPRKINAYRAFLSGSNVHGTGNIYSEADFITACPRTPLKPITFKFDNDPSRSTTNFSTIPGFQFAYQYTYKDGTESAISPYSDVAFPPSVLFQGASSYIDHTAFNECRIKIPLPPETEGQLTNLSAVTEVASIKLLAKQGREGSFLLIDELDFDLTSNGGDLYVFNIPSATEDYDEWAYEYKFHNDKIGVGVSTNEVNKQYNAVPRRAVSQAVSENRLMYGNYLEGFDSVKTDCEATVIYKEAPESFLTYNVIVNPSIEPIGAPGENKGKSVGFVLDFSEMPTSIPADTEISLNLTIAPDNNWHLYDYGENSFHQTVQLGGQAQEGINNLYDGVNTDQSLAEDSGEAGGAYLSENYGKIFGQGGGVKTIGQAWQVADTTNPAATIGPVANNITGYGTSAANPLIIKGGAVVFGVKIRSIEEVNGNAREKINEAVYSALLDVSLDGTSFEKVSGNSTAAYSFNAGLFSGKRIKQDYIGSDDTSTDPSAKLITAVKTSLEDLPTPPGGYFIVNSGDVKMELKAVDYSHYPFVPNTSSHFRLRMRKISNADVYTCIHATTESLSESHATDWIAISKSDMLLIEDNTYNGIGGWLQEKGLDPDLQFHLSPVSESTTDTISRQIGYLKYDGIIDSSSNSEFCLMDGEGGPGGGPSYAFDSEASGYDNFKLYNQGSVTVNPVVNENEDGGFTYSYANTVFYTGEVGLFQGADGAAPFSTVLPLLYRVNDVKYEYLLPDLNPSNTSEIDPKLPNFKRLQSPAEIISNQFYISSLESLACRSFKTEAMHDFGIVYYDQRGRNSFVNPLKTVFVDGYSNDERPGLNNGEGSGKGRVEIELKLLHEPPSWAHYYKIAYSKNTTISDFVQYSAGGAFAEQDEEDTISESNQNIYVSLNYLQNHPVSYVNSFGARTPEGGMNFYKFEEGDKLKVISYFEGNTRKYVSYEFDVVNVVNLGLDNNPLAIAPSESQTGDFVVIKNNPNAFGFTHGDVFAGIDKWGANCIIELRTPLKDLDADQRIFYEMPGTYEVRKISDNEFVHNPSSVTLQEGDVWFRPVATNVRELVEGQFEDIIGVNDSNDAPAKPNFKNVFLESSTATDLFKADNIGLGRPNVMLKGAKQLVKEATITYSDQSDPESKKLNYSSFNASLFNFKDLPEVFGGIQYMGDRSDSVFVIQEDKISRVPVNRSVLSDVAGSNSIIASKSVLNEPIFYYGQSGCDSDPSSVFDSGEEVYFCNKTVSKVYRWGVNTGIQELSSKGISSLLRAGLKRAVEQGQQVRVVGGYDPIKEEYLLSVINPEERNATGVQQVHQLTYMDPEEPTDEGGFEEEQFPDINVSRETLGFGPVDVGTTEINTLDISNDGDAALTISGFSFSDEQYDSNSSLPIILQPGEEIQVEFTFSPVSTGESEEILTIVSNDPDTPQYEVTLVASGIEIETGDFTTAYNELFGTSITDDDMSAELAVEYLLALSDQPEEEQPTIGLMLNLFGSFPEASQGAIASSYTSNAADIDGDGTVTVPELLSWLETASAEDYDNDSSVFNPQTSGDESGGGIDPSVLDLFASPSAAVEYILFKGDMTAEEFHLLKSHLIPGLNFDLNEDGLIGTADLLIFLGYFDEDYSLQDSAFNPDAPLVSTGNPFLQQTTLQAIQYLIVEGNMTVANYRLLASQVKDVVKLDYNGNGNVGTADQLILLSNINGPTFSPDDLALQQ